jgi:hypothetical protein
VCVCVCACACVCHDTCAHVQYNRVHKHNLAQTTDDGFPVSLTLSFVVSLQPRRRAMPAERACTLGACTHKWDDRFLIYSLAPLKAAWILCNGYIRHARHVCHVHTVPVLDPSFDSFTLNYILFLCRCVSGFLSRSTESASTSKREQTRERKSERCIKR